MTQDTSSTERQLLTCGRDGSELKLLTAGIFICPRCKETGYYGDRAENG